MEYKMIKSQLPKKSENRMTYRWLLVCIMVLVGTCFVDAAAPHYLDVSLTSGANNGTSQADAWRANNINNGLNKHLFEGGDQILIRRWSGTGTQPHITLNPATSRGAFRGVLAPQRSAADLNPTQQIIIDAYDVGANPIIDARGQVNTAGILLVNQDYWTIQNMQVTNDDPVVPKTMANRWGIFVYFTGGIAGTIHHGIKIINNNVYDVYGSFTKVPYVLGTYKGDPAPTSPGMYNVGGIQVLVEEPTKLDDVLFEGNQVTNITGFGIRFRGEGVWENGGMNWNNLSTNVTIRNNTVTNICDGILICGTEDVLVEYNVVDRAGGKGVMGIQVPDPNNPSRFCSNIWAATVAVGAIWPSCSRRGKYQFNEVKNTLMMPGDGYGLDNDMVTSGYAIFQYNYSHDNEGGFFMDCVDASLPDEPGIDNGSIVRYNISQNDGYGSVTAGNDGYTFYLYRGNAAIYNNTIYTSTTHSGHTPGQINFLDNGVAKMKYNWFRNNIFHGKEMNLTVNNTSFAFRNNCYYGGLNRPLAGNQWDIDPIVANPQFVAEGTGSDGRNTVQGYKLKPASACINAGFNIVDNGRRSFWGAGLYNGKPDIGAYEVPNIIPIVNLLLDDQPTVP
jgi:hypothetical protein